MRMAAEPRRLEFGIVVSEADAFTFGSDRRA